MLFKFLQRQRRKKKKALPILFYGTSIMLISNSTKIALKYMKNSRQISPLEINAKLLGSYQLAEPSSPKKMKPPLLHPWLAVGCKTLAGTPAGVAH